MRSLNQKKLRGFLSQLSKDLRDSVKLPSNQILLEQKNLDFYLTLAIIEMRKAQETRDKIFVRNAINHLILYLYESENY